MSLKLRNWGSFGLMLAIMITFIICGFWHGASLTFIVWGGLHGIAMAWDILTNKFRNKLKKKINSGIYRFISIFITFHFLCFSFIIFRVKSIPIAIKFYEKIFTSVDLSIAGQWINLYFYPFIVMILGLILHYTPIKWNTSLLNFYTKLHWLLKAISLVIIFVLIYQIFNSQSQPFIYLEF